jgi:hypothetical protein
MRIVIDIEGGEVTAAHVVPSDETSPPPPEVLRAAAAVGAQSAGPAPAAPGAFAGLEPRAGFDEGMRPVDAGGAPAPPETPREPEEERADPKRPSTTRRSTKRRSPAR